jgi:hypothetical protein
MNTLSSIIVVQLLLTGAADAFWGTRMLYRGRNEAPRSLQLMAEVEGRHSFVEGEHFTDRSAELESLGGDPFFLDDYNDAEDDPADDNDESSGSEERHDQEMAAVAVPSSLLAGLAMASGGGVMDEIGKVEKKWSATDGKGPAPKPPPPPLPDDWEWDGIVDENAHMD